MTVEARAHSLERIQSRVILLKGSLSVLSTSVVPDLEHSLPRVFARGYPQDFTHGDFSQTNILVDEDTYMIIGIFD